MGGGILPMALHNNKIYYLFAREENDKNIDIGMWSDFGGAKEKRETYYDTAIREGWEESGGFLGDIKDIKKLVDNKLFDITVNGYRTYIILTEYDEELPKIFMKDYKREKEEYPYNIAKNGFYEKDKLRWIEHNNLLRNIKIFRPWYRKIVKILEKEEIYN